MLAAFITALERGLKNPDIDGRKIKYSVCKVFEMFEKTNVSPFFNLRLLR